MFLQRYSMDMELVEGMLQPLTLSALHLDLRPLHFLWQMGTKSVFFYL